MHGAGASPASGVLLHVHFKFDFLSLDLSGSETVDRKDGATRFTEIALRTRLCRPGARACLVTASLWVPVRLEVMSAATPKLRGASRARKRMRIPGCRLWVITGHPKRLLGMSALRPEADLTNRFADVRLVPEADILLHGRAFI
jgi:hypothetical protein